MKNLFILISVLSSTPTLAWAIPIETRCGTITRARIVTASAFASDQSSGFQLTVSAGVTAFYRTPEPALMSTAVMMLNKTDVKVCVTSPVGQFKVLAIDVQLP